MNVEPVFMLLALAATQGFGEATDNAARAYAMQEHLDDMADRYQRTLFTDWERQQAGNAALVAKVLAERKITFTWRVP